MNTKYTFPYTCQNLLGPIYRVMVSSWEYFRLSEISVPLRCVKASVLYSVNFLSHGHVFFYIWMISNRDMAYISETVRIHNLPQPPPERFPSLD